MSLCVCRLHASYRQNRSRWQEGSCDIVPDQRRLGSVLRSQDGAAGESSVHLSPGAGQSPRRSAQAGHSHAEETERRSRVQRVDWLG